MVKSRVLLGMGDLPPLIGNPYYRYINPYYWVDFPHPLLYGNHGSLDPSTFEHVFPIENGDFPASHVSFQGCIHRKTCKIKIYISPSGWKHQG